MKYQLLREGLARILSPIAKSYARGGYRAAIHVNRSATLANVGLVFSLLILFVVAAVLSRLQYATKGSRSCRNV